mmetsp:Transcript_15898/g.45705  ORF Transcript_15898/g.45705 Transcript_15898/m.45705 type:complete len:146 (+) Transcript_15898:961-1398(+)
MTSDDSRRLVDEGLARPLVIGGDGASGGNDGNGEQNKSKGKKQRKKKGNRVGSTAYRFHFDATPPPTAQGGNGGNGGNAGFRRLLLHAVYQFHGMVASSSTSTYPCAQSEKKTTERVLTVTGTCRGREHHIVAEACRHVAKAPCR